MKSLKTILSTLLLAFAATAFAQKGTTMKLWPYTPEVASADEKDEAEITVYLPDAKKATGRAIVCCPGGGYSHLAMDHEGHQWAPFFNTQGIALIVLKYRMPHGNRLVPISDAEEAVKTVRRHAAEGLSRRVLLRRDSEVHGRRGGVRARLRGVFCRGEMLGSSPAARKSDYLRLKL